LFKFKEGENINHRNTFSILRIKLKLLCEQNLSLTQKLDKRGRFAKVSYYESCQKQRATGGGASFYLKVQMNQGVVIANNHAFFYLNEELMV